MRTGTQNGDADDKTLAFSKKQVSVSPFTQQQIQADPHYQAQTIREQDDKIAAQ